MIFFFAGFLLLLSLSIAHSASPGGQSLIPLSPNDYSFSRGNPASNIVVEFYIDLTCSACQDSWPTLNQVVAQYSDRVFFKYHVFPLPYHQQAFILAKAAQVVNYYSPDNIFSFMDTVYTNQAAIYNSATADMTYNQVVQLVEKWAVNDQLTSQQYYDGMNSSTTVGNTLEMQARYTWKYSTLHSVYATPTFVIQGLKVMGIDDDITSWEKTLDPLLSASKTRRHEKTKN